MRIDVTNELHPWIDGTPITEAMSVSMLHALFGPPSRIDGGGTPAPVKHRNNHIHIYDDLGIYFYEHHCTRLIDGMNIVFWPEEHGFRFTPRHAFSGTLCLAGYTVPARVEVGEFLRGCPTGFKHLIGGWTGAEQGGFAVHFTGQGARLQPGRRSKVRYLVDLSLSWPHDPWARSALESAEG